MSNSSFVHVSAYLENAEWKLIEIYLLFNILCNIQDGSHV